LNTVICVLEWTLQATPYVDCRPPKKLKKGKKNKKGHFPR
jgi:hypothetical protein